MTNEMKVKFIETLNYSNFTMPVDTVQAHVDNTLNQNKKTSVVIRKVRKNGNLEIDVSSLIYITSTSIDP